MRYHLTPVRMAIIKKPTDKNVGKDVEKRYTFVWEFNWCSHQLLICKYVIQYRLYKYVIQYKS